MPVTLGLTWILWMGTMYPLDSRAMSPAGATCWAPAPASAVLSLSGFSSAEAERAAKNMVVPRKRRHRIHGSQARRRAGAALRSGRRNERTRSDKDRGRRPGSGDPDEPAGRELFSCGWFMISLHSRMAGTCAGER